MEKEIHAYYTYCTYIISYKHIIITCTCTLTGLSPSSEYPSMIGSLSNSANILLADCLALA